MSWEVLGGMKCLIGGLAFEGERAKRKSPVNPKVEDSWPQRALMDFVCTGREVVLLFLGATDKNP